MARRVPYEGPTEPLGPGGPAGVVHEPVVAPAIDPSLTYIRLERAIDGLRTWLLIVAVAVLAALGVAIYALVTADGNGNGNGTGTGAPRGYATNARVDRISSELKALRASPAGGADTASLAARVAALEATAKTPSAGGGSAAALAGRVATLETEVKTLSSRPSTPDATGAIQQLSSRVDALAAQVAQLKQSQPAAP